MSIISGYTLNLYCDCEKCSNIAYGKAEDEFVSDAKNAKQHCFKQARIKGWSFNKEKTKCFAPGHKLKTKPKRCNICRDVVYIKKNKNDNKYTYFIYCPKCMQRGKEHNTIKEAIFSWNKMLEEIEHDRLRNY